MYNLKSYSDSNCQARASDRHREKMKGSFMYRSHSRHPIEGTEQTHVSEVVVGNRSAFVQNILLSSLSILSVSP